MKESELTRPGSRIHFLNGQALSTESHDTSLETAIEWLASIERELSAVRTLLDRSANEKHAVRRLAPGDTPHAEPGGGSTERLTAEDQVPLSIYCFGQFEVRVGHSQLVQRRTGKGRGILQYLASRGYQRVPSDVLIEALWPGVGPDTGKNRLRVAMHHLRQAFASLSTAVDGKDLLLYQEGCYGLNPQYSLWTDVQEFESNWETALRLEHTRQLADAVPYYLQAEGLYRGDFLEEDQLEDWTINRREELKDVYLTVLDRLSHYWLETGNDDAAIQYWKKILFKNPSREDIYRKLIARLAARGQRASALHWYNLCVQSLREHLDIDPEPETMLLQRDLLSGSLTPLADS